MAQPPIFLERQSYRRRRLMDVIKLLPFLGFVIWMVPLLWPTGQADQEGLQTSQALRYLFGSWMGLVVIGLLLWLRARHPSAPDTKT